MSDFLIIVLNGVVEGLTEFIPVSSTGHLIILEHFLALPLENSASFQIAIQLGAILAAVVHYRDFLKKSIVNMKTSTKVLVNFIVAMLPAMTVAFFAYDLITGALFNPLSVTVALFVGALLMLAADHWHQKVSKPTLTQSLETVTVKQAFLIGCFQILSLWPGMSRSGSSIVGGLFAKIDYKVSADFSFILGIPVIGMAVIYDLLRQSAFISSSDLKLIFIGAFISFVMGLFAIKTVIRLLKQWQLRPFALYRIILALVLLCFIMG